MILHHSRTRLLPAGRPAHMASRARIGSIGLGAIVALLGLLNVASVA